MFATVQVVDIVYGEDILSSRKHVSPYAKLQCVEISDVHWTSGFWADKYDLCHEVMIPNMWEIFTNPEISHAYSNFKIAAGLMEGEHHGPKFNDGDFYKWLEAVAAAYAVTNDESLDALMDETIDVITKAQRSDGYIHTPVNIDRINGTKEVKAFNDQLHFETYNMGHLMTTACVHYQATGKTTLLNAAKKAADYLIQVCEDMPQELASVTICPSHYMGITDLYRVTNDPKYLELVKTLIDIRSLNQSGTDHNQDRIPFREQTVAVGHAVRANYLYAGASDVYMETGDKTLLETLERIWQDVAFRKMYVTGSTGALYDGASPDGSKKHNDIQLVHQAYGRPYQLPNLTAYNETCATIGFGLWNWRMLQVTGGACYADLLELALYNGVLSGISLDGKHFFYTNPLRMANDLPFSLRWPGERQTYISSFCCPPNVVRTIAEANRYAYCVSSEGLWINLYGSNELNTKLRDGKCLALTQKTDYPWDGHVEIEVRSSERNEFAIRLRIPSWAVRTLVKVNGERLEGEPIPSSYYRIQRRWSEGDRIEIEFPMPVRLLEANPFVEELRNQTAIQRGPVVYCLESSDLPENVKVSEIVIPRSIQLTPRFEASLLAGVTTLNGMALQKAEGDWTNCLYREIERTLPKRIPIRLIPYYAWGNRGKSEMTVWIPLQ